MQTPAQVLNRINPQSPSDSATKLTTARSERPGDAGYTYADDERAKVNGFYAMMRIAWGKAKYGAMFEDEQDLVHSRRYWAPEILKHSQEVLKRAVDTATKRRLQGDKRFDWPDIGAILSLISEADKPQATDWEHARIAAADARARAMIALPSKGLVGKQLAAALADLRKAAQG